RTVLDRHRLAKGLRQFVSNRARNDVTRTALRIADHELHRSARVGLHLSAGLFNAHWTPLYERLTVGSMAAIQRARAMFLAALARISHTFCDTGAIWSERVSRCKSLSAAGQADPFRQSDFQPPAGRL